MKSLSCVLAVLLWAAAAPASETPETIVIRRTLGNDLSGHRRGDADLALSAYHESFVAFHGHGYADPRAWTVLHENRAAYAADLRQQLGTYRYETERTLPFIHVRGDVAVVTSVDSGKVIRRETGAEADVHVRRLWTMVKTEDDWLVTGLVEELGDSALTMSGVSARAEEIDAVLAREREAWVEDDADEVADVFAEACIGYDGYGTVRPETWKVVFSGAKELGTWVQRRLRFTDYQIDRQVVYSTVGPQRQVGLAVTREAVTTRHRDGDAVHRAERYVLWTLVRQGGSWKVTNMCYDVGLPR